MKFRFAADGTNDVGAVGGIGEVPQVLARSTKIWANILPRWRVGVLLSLFQRPLLFGVVNDAQVVDTGIALGGLTRTKLGIAIADSSPMTATTIMISTWVKPAFG